MIKRINIKEECEIESSLYTIKCASSILNLFLDQMDSERFGDDEQHLIYSAIHLINDGIERINTTMDYAK